MNMKRRWPGVHHGLATDTPIVTSAKVLEGAPVALVAHLHNGSWQFLDADGKGPDDMRVVHFVHLLEREPKLDQFRRLRAGEVRVMTTAGQWVAFRFGSDEEFDAWCDSLGD